MNYVCWIYIYIYINSTTPKRHVETLRNWNIPFQLKKQNTYRNGIDNLAMDSEIINKTASTGYAWIRQCKQPLRTEKSSLKTKSLPTQKSSTKLLPRETHGLNSTYSRCGLWNLQWNCIHGWLMNSAVQTAPRDSEIINELVSRVTHGFDSTKSPYGLINLQRTGVTGDAWIRQPKQPIGIQKSSTKLLARVTHGFDSPNSP